MKRSAFVLAASVALVFGMGLVARGVRADVTWAGDSVIALDANDLALGPVTTWVNTGGEGGAFQVVTNQPDPPGTALPLPEVKQSIPGPDGIPQNYVEFRRGGGGGYGDDASAMLWDEGAPAEITAGHSFSVEGWVYLATNEQLQTFFSIGRRGAVPAETTNNFAFSAGGGGSDGKRAIGLSTTNVDWLSPAKSAPDYNYFAATYDSATTTVSLYVNGALHTSLATPVTITTDQPVYLGAMWFNANSKYLQQGLKNGGIARLRVHEGVLSAADVQNNYDFEKATFQGSMVSFGAPGLPTAVISGTDIRWTVPGGTDVSTLAPVYATSPSATGDPASGTPQDFTSPVTYTVSAADGGTKTYTVTVTVAYDGLLARTYNDSQGVAFLDPIATLLAVPPSGMTIQTADIAYPGDVFIPAFPGLLDQETFSILWTGWFKVTKDGPGDYTFGTASDDGSVLYLDLNDDGVFDSPGELIVNNNLDQGTTVKTATVNLTMDQVRIAIGYYENGGGNEMHARFQKGAGVAWEALVPISGKTDHFFLAPFGWAGNPVIALDANELEPGAATTWNNAAGPGGTFATVTNQPDPPGTALPVPQVKQSVPGLPGIFQNYVEFYRGGGGGYGDDASAMQWDLGAPAEITAGHSLSLEAWVYLTTEVELQTYFSIGRRAASPVETVNNFACAAGWTNTGGNSLRAVGMTTANLTWLNPTMFTPEYNHIAVTYDSATGAVSVYLNGVLNNSVALAAPGLNITTGQPVYLGTTWFNANSKFLQQGMRNGGISRLRVHDGVLSADQVGANYHFERMEYQFSILTFGLPGEPAAISGTDILWSVPFGTDVTALAPVYTTSPRATGAPASGSTQDFTGPVAYTITADNGATKTYTVTVQVRGEYERLLATTYNDTFGASFLDPISNLLAVAPSGSTAQIADITYDGDVFIPAFPGLVDQETFSILWTAWFDVTVDGQGEYTFGTASDDGSVVYLDLNNDGVFDSPGELIVSNNADQGTTVKTANVTLNMDLVRIAIGYYENGSGNAMYAKFKKGAGVPWGLLDPVNGRTGHFWAKLDGDPMSAEKAILAFGTPGQPATISGTDITWTLPAGTDVTALSPAYAVSAFATGFPGTGSTRDFTSPVQYTITAEDGSTQVYTVTVPSDPPTGLVATAGIEQVSLAWSAPAGGSTPTGYQVFRGGARIASVAATPTTYVDADPALVPGTQYCYTVKAVVGSVAGAPSNESCATPTPAAPNPPTDLAATGGIEQVSLVWVAPAAGTTPTGYQVLRDGAKIADVAATPTTYVDADPALVPGTQYCYTVKAVAGDLASAASNESCATPEAAGGMQKPMDYNQDALYDLSDAVSILNHLFLGGAAPPCATNSTEDPANIALLDANGDGAIDISDPVHALGFLFLGGPRPVMCVDDDCPCFRIVGCPEVSACDG